MKTKLFKSVFLVSLIAIILSSCTKDLNRSPFYGLNTDNVYNDPSNYIHVLAKLYAGLSLTGNQGPAGKPDLDPSSVDEGYSQYIRTLFNIEELPTDEAVCNWNDPGIPELHQMAWQSDGYWSKAMYYRIFYQIPLCNEFIRESSDANMSSRGFSDADQTTIREYRAEARFLRALSYYHAIDLFGSVPFVDENDLPGSFYPKQISRVDLFNYVESELLDLQNLLPDPRTNEYGRVDKACAWFLLAKLYLNAEVYTGQQRYTDCITYASKVATAGYSLEPVYANLFRTDNNLSNEIIFPVTFDGLKTTSYGGTTFLVHCAVGGTMNPLDFGIAGGWSGYRATVDSTPDFGFANHLFGVTPQNPKGDTLDSRNMFWTNGQVMQINDISSFTYGYPITKWKNISSTGAPGSDPTGGFVDTDFPMFRLADDYLMYAEAVLRGGTGGDMATALGYVNAIRERAYGNSSHDMNSIDLNFILDERGRELEWEAQRRTDLIRFGEFTSGSYLWPWKGGVKQGEAVGDFRNLYPIPIDDIIANPNLVQNPGY